MMKKLLFVSLLLTSSMYAVPSKSQLVGKALVTSVLTAGFIKLTLDRLFCFKNQKHWSNDLSGEGLQRNEEAVALDILGVRGFLYLTYLSGRSTVESVMKILE